MSYYMGDYYQGDYYQGDPFWGFLGRAASSAIRGLTGIGIGRGLTRPRIIPAMPAAAGAAATAITKIVKPIGAIVAKHPVLSAAGAAAVLAGTSGIEAGRMMAPSMMGARGGMRGFHMSKPRRGVPPHMVRNRHMRVTNPRALRRALRRAHGFARLAMKTIHLVHPRKKARFGGFRKKKRAR